MYKSFLIKSLILSFLFISCSVDNKEVFELSTSSSPEEGGTLTPSGGTFDDGEVIELTANASENYRFIEWRGDQTGNSNPVTVTINRDKDIVGVFELREYLLNVFINGEGLVSEEIVSRKTDYDYGTEVKLTATPDSNWWFESWEGDLSGNKNEESLVIDSEKNVTANFKKLSSVYLFGGSENDFGSGTIEIGGYYYLAGTTRSNDNDFNGLNTSNDFKTFILKLDSEGTVSSKTVFEGNAITNGMFKTSDGGFVVFGRFSSNEGVFNNLNRGSYDAYLMKFNREGDLSFVKSYGGSDFDIIESAIETSDGGFLFTGNTSSNDGDFSSLSGSTRYDAYLIKTDDQGSIQWIKTLSGSGNDFGTSVAEIPGNQGYIFTGNTGSIDGDFNGFTEQTRNMIVAKYSVDGQREWLNTYLSEEYNSTNYAYKALIVNNEIKITGGLQNETSPDTEIAFLTLDMEGNLNQYKSFGYGFGDNIIELPNGNILITGNIGQNNSFLNISVTDTQDALLLIIDPAGNVITTKVFGGSESENVYDSDITVNGKIIMAGLTYSSDKVFTENNGESDAFLIVYDFKSLNK